MRLDGSASIDLAVVVHVDYGGLAIRVYLPAQPSKPYAKPAIANWPQSQFGHVLAHMRNLQQKYSQQPGLLKAFPCDATRLHDLIDNPGGNAESLQVTQ